MNPTIRSIEMVELLQQGWYISRLELDWYHVAKGLAR
jgi:hypothetical protein